MKMPTTEQPEIQELQLQKALRQWQNQQRVQGNLFLFLCLAAFVSFALFCLDPCPGTTWLMVVSLMLMVSAGASMFRAAHAVVQHQQRMDSPVSATRAPETRALPAAAYYGNDTGPAATPFGQPRPWIFPETQN